jgi:hypothetical protein
VSGTRCFLLVAAAAGMLVGIPRASKQVFEKKCLVSLYRHVYIFLISLSPEGYLVGGAPEAHGGKGGSDAA